MSTKHNQHAVPPPRVRRRTTGAVEVPQPSAELPPTAELLRALRLCVSATSRLPHLQLTPAQASLLGGQLFAQGPAFVDLVALEVERQPPGLQDPEGRGATLRARQERVHALHYLWCALLQMADQMRQHQLVEQAAVLHDATRICQETYARNGSFPTLNAARRLLNHRLQRWRGRRAYQGRHND